MTTIAYERKRKNNPQLLKNSNTKKNTQSRSYTEDDDLSRKILSMLPQGVYLAETEGEISRVRKFKKKHCNDDRMGVSEFQNDGFDDNAYIFFGTGINSNIISSSRLLLDSKKGFPEEEKFPASVESMRKDGKKLAELGRLLITGDNRRQFKHHYAVNFKAAQKLNIDIILIVMKQKHIASHNKMMAISVLSKDMGLSWDEEQVELCLVAWDIKATQAKFYKWIGLEPKNYSNKEWDGYSPFHLGVLTSVQHEVYEHIATKLYGNVLDLGCGSGRVMSYISNNLRVNSYTGVDSSKDMIKQASWLKSKLSLNTSNLLHSNIEDIEGEYDSIFSVHSFYSWSNPEKILRHVNNLLPVSGVFILITPNDNFDVARLTRLVNQELLGHPYHDEFLAINIAIAEKAKTKGLYGSIDTLIGQVRNAGFQVKVAHSDFFLGGASYLELTKVS